MSFMILETAVLLFIIILFLAGCIAAKNKILKIFLGIAGGLCVTVYCLFMLLVFEMNYAVVNVDSQTSADGKYEVIMQSVGSPVFFSSADGRFVLKKGKKTISKYKFVLCDDGGSIRSSIWSVTWYSDYVRIVVSGSEQSDEEYDLYFDGRTAEVSLDTVYGKTKSELAASAEKERVTEPRADTYGTTQAVPENSKDNSSEYDENGYPLTDEFEGYKQQLAAIADYISIQDGASLAYGLTAKGWPYAVISSESCEVDGISATVEQCLIFNETYTGEGKREYVYEEFCFDADGNEVRSTRILDFFLVDTDTLEVTDENTTQWH